MLRIIKRYNLAFKTSSTDNTPIPATEIAFSSYPGVLQSIDDWYVTSSGLMVTETTNENYNDDLWKKVKPTESVRELITRFFIFFDYVLYCLDCILLSWTFSCLRVFVQFSLHDWQLMGEVGLRFFHATTPELTTINGWW